MWNYFSSIIPWSISFVSLLFVMFSYVRTGKKDNRESIQNEEARFDGIKESLLKANMKLDDKIETYLMVSKPELSFLSSSIAKENFI